MKELLIVLSKGNPEQANQSSAKLFHALALCCLVIIIPTGASAQTRTYPKEIRGYKVERRVVEVKKPEKQNGKSGTNPTTSPGTNPSPNPSTNQTQSGTNNSDGQTSSESTSESDEDALIRLGTPQLARVTPLGITFEVPVVVSPVKQSGHVDFLMFEDMVVNGSSVEIDEYHRAFDLPNKDPLTLREPLRFYIYLPNALLAALGDWSDSKETWPVTGRIYVFGKFKKGPFSFKRCIPVELSVTMRNPLKRD
jgi:hypothetical protein